MVFAAKKTNAMQMMMTMPCNMMMCCMPLSVHSNTSNGSPS
jgi:hypothetical protein